jgi:hypothetical protein
MPACLKKSGWSANGEYWNCCSRSEKCVSGWLGEKHSNKPLIGVRHNRQDLLPNTGEGAHEGSWEAA